MQGKGSLLVAIITLFLLKSKINIPALEQFGMERCDFLQRITYLKRKRKPLTRYIWKTGNVLCPWQLWL